MYNYIFFIIFNRFPKNKQLYKLWVDAVGVEVKKNSLLCSKHFEDKYLDRFPGSKAHLRSSAIPTLFDHLNERARRRLLNEYNKNVCKKN